MCHRTPQVILSDTLVLSNVGDVQLHRQCGGIGMLYTLIKMHVLALNTHVDTGAQDAVGSWIQRRRDAVLEERGGSARDAAAAAPGGGRPLQVLQLGMGC